MSAQPTNPTAGDGREHAIGPGRGHGHDHERSREQHHDHGHSHDHDHSHGHGYGHHDDGTGGRRRGLGRVVARLRPHSHDPADSIDTALESSERGIRAVKISFVALMITASAQVGLVIVTGSVALLADTVHNFADALTAVPLYVAFRLARRPASRRYTYGFRRAEDLAGVFVVAMITLSALVAGWQAVERLVAPRPIHHVGIVFAAGLIGLAGNELVALYRIREGRAIGSAALVADGFHARTDGLTSLAVALAAAGHWAGFERPDPLIGLVISAAIFAVLWGAGRQIYHRLMDAIDPAIVDLVVGEAGAVAGVQGVELPRVRWLGHGLVADLTICVDADQSVVGGHSTAAAVHHRLVERVPHLADTHIHVHPAR
jgi:cation diffusion facilitator family transporter